MRVVTEAFRHRYAGVLLHPRSLPAVTAADRIKAWLDFMQTSGLAVWQILPLGIPHEDGSPYQTLSVFAVDPQLMPDASERCSRPEPALEAFQAFCDDQSHWLDDFALYMVIKGQQGGQPWDRWPQALRDREPGQLGQLRRDCADELLSIKWQQFALLEYWHGLHQQARELGLYIYGDLPIFVAYDSADVWAHRELFLLDADGQPEFVAGVPPDYFSATGQRWGNPHYDWQAMQADGFSWWRARIRYLLEWVDIFRIDHFRGLEAVWMIPADAETAIDGFWQQTPGDELLSMIEREIGPVPMVAEDLGIITDAVRELKSRHHLPGMSVLQFGFDEFEDNPHKPHNITHDSIVYTGTHDNNTVNGWFATLTDAQQEDVRARLGISEEQDVAWSMIEIAMRSKACLAIVPMQDFLGLGEAARMNTPGTMHGNWSWMMPGDVLREDLSRRIHDVISASGRLPDEQ